MLQLRSCATDLQSRCPLALYSDPVIMALMAILGLVTTYMNLLSTWNALKSNFIRVMGNPTPPRTKREAKFTREHRTTMATARVHAYNVCARNCLFVCVVCTCIHAYSVNAMWFTYVPVLLHYTTHTLTLNYTSHTHTTRTHTIFTFPLFLAK